MKRPLSRLLLLLACMAFFPLVSSAQDYTPIIDHYMAESDLFSPIYNGMLPPRYRAKYDGTFYLISDDYMDGWIVYNGKRYNNLKLNLNAHLDELYVRMPNREISSVLIKSYVEDFGLEDMMFTHFFPAGEPGAPNEGYYRVLHQGDHVRVLKQTRKRYANANPNETTSSHRFEESSSYYLEKDGAFYTFKNKGSFLAVLRTHKKELRQHIKEHKLKFNKAQKDISFASCAAFYDSIR